MNTSLVGRLTEIPSYQDCGTDISGIHGLVDIALDVHEPEIPELFADPTQQSVPFVHPLPPAIDHDALIEIKRPFRAVEAYRVTGWPYCRRGAWARRSVVDRLAAAHSMLPDQFGLAIWDAWRDPLLQAHLHEVAYLDPHLPPGFVNPPSADPRTPPPHATGGTLDLTLTFDGIPLNLGTTFDEFVPQAMARAFEAVSAEDRQAMAVRNLRRLLRRVMIDSGFVQLDCEWWHFEYGTRLWAAVLATVPIYGTTSPEDWS